MNGLKPTAERMREILRIERFHCHARPVTHAIGVRPSERRYIILRRAGNAEMDVVEEQYIQHASHHYFWPQRPHLLDLNSDQLREAMNARDQELLDGTHDFVELETEMNNHFGHLLT